MLEEVLIVHLWPSFVQRNYVHEHALAEGSDECWVGKVDVPNSVSILN